MSQRLDCSHPAGESGFTSQVIIRAARVKGDSCCPLRGLERGTASGSKQRARGADDVGAGRAQGRERYRR